MTTASGPTGDKPPAAPMQGGPKPQPAMDTLAGFLSGGRRGIRLQTLIQLRWLAVGGQSAALAVTVLGLGFEAPLAPCLLLIALSACLNLGLTLSRPGQRQARDWETTAQLAFDILQLAALLHVTGGVVNPFSLLLIAPVTLAASTLPPRRAAGLGALALAAVVVLSLTPYPLPWAPGERFEEPMLYRIGVGVALALGVAFTAGYAGQAAAEAARMELALNVTQSVLAREQRLAALGGLAAAAAHELGTPLATIMIVAKEMAREAPPGLVRDDAETLVAQAERCREILRRLTETPEAGDAVHARMSLSQFVEEVIEPHLGCAGDVAVTGAVSGPPGLVPPEILRLPEVLHAMTSLVENAADFARTTVRVTAYYGPRRIAVEIADDGPGFAADMLPRLGQPYVTSRPGGEGSPSGHEGMGLGFFIAKTLLERTGAQVEFRNHRHGGAVVVARWPRARIEAPAQGPS